MNLIPYSLVKPSSNITCNMYTGHALILWLNWPLDSAYLVFGTSIPCTSFFIPGYLALICSTNSKSLPSKLSLGIASCVRWTARCISGMFRFDYRIPSARSCTQYLNLPLLWSWKKQFWWARPRPRAYMTKDTSLNILAQDTYHPMYPVFMPLNASSGCYYG